MEKSPVSLERKACVATGKLYDTNGLILDRRMKPILNKHTVTGWGLSPEVQEKIDEGYIAMVEIDTLKSIVTNGKILPQDAYRLGLIAYIRKQVASEIFNCKLSSVNFVDSNVIAHLQKMSDPENIKNNG